jgi:hypothetical protein
MACVMCFVVDSRANYTPSTTSFLDLQKIEYWEET